MHTICFHAYTRERTHISFANLKQFMEVSKKVGFSTFAFVFSVITLGFYVPLQLLGQQRSTPLNLSPQ